VVQVSKTNTGLVAYAKAQLGLPYWYGTYGQVADKALYDRKKAQYPKHYTASDFASQYGQRVHDCVGLFKGYLWSSTAKAVPIYNSAQDKNVGGIKKLCSKTGNIKSIPAVPGVAVFIGTSHIGYSDGCGGVYEARGHAYGVVHTKLKDRPWDAWGYLPWIAYETAKVDVSGYPVLRKGSTGIYITKAQTILRKEGYKGKTGTERIRLKVDGNFGVNTDYAVRNFQRDKKITVDGIIGPATWDKLVNG
jgi:hypothetical protein